MDTGWVKIYRSLIGWEWYSDPNTLCLWIHILLTVNYEPKQWRGIVIQPGQMVTSIGNLAEESGLSIQQTRTALDHLKLTGEITSTSTNRYTLITVVKWADFQANERDTNKQLTSNLTDNQQANNKQPNNQSTTTKEYKEDKKERNKEKRNIFIAPSLEEVADYIQENGYSISPEHFLDYYESNGWMVGKSKMKNWKAAVRTWQRNQRPQTTKGKDELPF